MAFKKGQILLYSNGDSSDLQQDPNCPRLLGDILVETRCPVMFLGYEDETRRVAIVDMHYKSSKYLQPTGVDASRLDPAQEYVMRNLFAGMED